MATRWKLGWSGYGAVKSGINLRDSMKLPGPVSYDVCLHQLQSLEGEGDAK